LTELVNHDGPGQSIRLASKKVNDRLVCLTLAIAGEHNKPGKTLFTCNLIEKVVCNNPKQFSFIPD
jgi:hypothetical protein